MSDELRAAAEEYRKMLSDEDRLACVPDFDYSRWRKFNAQRKQELQAILATAYLDALGIEVTK